MATKSLILNNGVVLVVKAENNHVVVLYTEAGQDKEIPLKDMKEVRAWVKKHYNEEL
jgi:hypothetical protein